MYKFRSSLLFLVAWLAFLLAFFAQTATDAGPGNATMTVTALGKKMAEPPAINREDVQFLVNKERAQIAILVAAALMLLTP